MNTSAWSLALLLACPAAAPADVRYTVVDLGSLGNFTSSANAISQTGWVVGHANTPESGYDRAVLFAGPAGVFDPPVVITGEGASGASALGVNRDGLIVGYSDSFSLNAFVMDFAAVPQTGPGALNALGGLVSQANGVNDGDEVVGSAMDPGTGFSHAVKWTRPAPGAAFSMQPLGELGGPGSTARAVSNGGWIVGSADRPDWLGVPCYWTADGTAHQMGVETSSFGEALAVNDHGEAAGYAYTTAGTVAFYWSEATGAVNVGNLGNYHAIARGINNRGDVVGQAYIPGTSAVQHAFIWREGVLTDLMTLIPAGSGWVLWDATAITDDGRIVGGGVKDGQPRAFMLVPLPCPADLGRTGGERGPDGVLDNNDFVAFVGAFFNAETAADLGGVGGVAGPDGRLDNNDFVVFIDRFFAGC